MNEAKTNASIRLKIKTKARIEEIAKLKRRKPTELMRIVLEDYVEQFEDIQK